MFSVIFKMADTTNAYVLPARPVSCTDFWDHEQDTRQHLLVLLLCINVTYRIMYVSWQLYRSTYRIVEKCIVAGLEKIDTFDGAGVFGRAKNYGWDGHIPRSTLCYTSFFLARGKNRGQKPLFHAKNFKLQPFVSRPRGVLPAWKDLAALP